MLFNSRSKHLSAEEQIALLKDWKQNENNHSLNKLISSNYRSVLKLAHKYYKHNSQLDLDDLIQEGMLGLSKAVDKFDLSKNVNFLTYAHYWIDQKIRSYVMDNRCIVRLGTTEDGRKIFGSLAKAKKEAEKSCSTQEEKIDFITKQLNVKKENLLNMMSVLSGHDISLDKKVSDSDEDSPSMGDMMSSKTDLSSEDILQSKEATLLLDKIIEENLSEVEKIIVKSRFFSYPKLTYQNIGEAVCLSRQKVKEIEQNCYKRIKNVLKIEYSVYSSAEIL